MYDLIEKRISESIDVKKDILNNPVLLEEVSKTADIIISCIKNGGKIVLCGNGGSASDALHFAGEIVGRFQRERSPWAAIVLNSDVTTMTAIANDYGYDDMFARQAEGLLTDKDVLIGISTSGNSENVYRAVKVAHKKGAKVVAFLGRDGGKIYKEADFHLVVPSMNTARIQECHITLIHIICEIVENEITTV
ncbi:MAG: SIS domain-containing protein [Lachnospiraceae bacterium]|nr:SIS domain-containing protein [Lachnospiraceae bacterium]